MKKSFIPAPAVLGMLGGGQLGRYFVMAAHELGYQVWVLDPDEDSPAGRIADRHLCADYDDAVALAELAAGCAAVTTEFENVPAETLAILAEQVPVYPSAAAVSVCQDRIAEKTFLKMNGLPHGPFFEINTLADIQAAPAHLFPAILKAARLGYDGKGQAVVDDRAAAEVSWHELGSVRCILEAKLPLDYEISVVLARGQDGKVKAFPSAENRHRNGILDVSVVPAWGSACVTDNACDVAEKLAGCLDYVGTLGVEFFVSRGELVVNEMAPRPHNSGHYTIDACATNQFQQQVRALCGLPLGDSHAHSAAVMVNLLGDLWFDGCKQREPDWCALLAIPGVCLHLYGKQAPRAGRKMGHFTVVGGDAQQVYERAMQARKILGLPDA
ncbi:MAG: 5-(carboxyamino)imidazole ribonucleotide synthase [Rhodocyclaceae bacterium]|jgi:5-(carboxyamino)imidazole ribonucleotide synthase|nr:5-(carboxyamino)imidazole ribonucleotide synthase [Rhodocyclaceae bacterium]